jgi:hypothetical protein
MGGESVEESRSRAGRQDKPTNRFPFPYVNTTRNRNRISPSGDSISGHNHGSTLDKINEHRDGLFINVLLILWCHHECVMDEDEHSRQSQVAWPCAPYVMRHRQLGPVRETGTVEPHPCASSSVDASGLHDASLSSSSSLVLLSLSHRQQRYGLFHQSASRATPLSLPGHLASTTAMAE